MKSYTVRELFSLENTIAAEIFEDITYPFEVLPKIGQFIKDLGAKLDKNVFEEKGENIWIAKSAKVAPSASITGPCIIDEDAEIRHCAFIRGNALVGKGAVVGNSTELKNVILFDKVQVPHYNYVAWSHLTLGGGMKAITCCADESITDGTTNVFLVASEDMGTYMGYSLLRVKEDSPFSDVRSAVTMDRIETVEVEASETHRYVPSGKVAVNLATGEVIEGGKPLPGGATYAVGYPFEAELVTIRPEPSPQETIQFEIKNAKSVEVRTLHGSSYEIRAHAAPERIPFTRIDAEPTVAADGTVTLDASDHKTVLQGANSGDGRIRLRNAGVWPMSILQLSVNYEIQPLSNAAG